MVEKRVKKNKQHDVKYKLAKQQQLHIKQILDTIQHSMKAITPSSSYSKTSKTSSNKKNIRKHNAARKKKLPPKNV